VSRGPLGALTWLNAVDSRAGPVRARHFKWMVLCIAVFTRGYLSGNAGYRSLVRRRPGSREGREDPRSRSALVFGDFADLPGTC
jgi:hypothetical protein